MKVLYDECIETLRDNKCSECNDFYQCSVCDYFQERYEKGRADAIDECINTIVGTQSQIALNEPYDKHLFTVMADRQHEIIDLLEQLKEQK